MMLDRAACQRARLGEALGVAVCAASQVEQLGKVGLRIEAY